MSGVDRARLRALLKEKGRSARDVSLKAGLGATAVKDILSGRSKRPEFATLQAIAQELGVSVFDFTTSGDAGAAGPGAASTDERIVPRMLEVRYRVRAGLWQEVEFEEPPERNGYPAVPHPRYAEWPQWLERVEGDSVNLKVPEGHYIHVVDALEMGYKPKTGDWVVVERHRDQGAIRERTIKQVEVVPGVPRPLVRLWPRSSNPKWSEPIDLQDGARPGEEVEARIVGLVVGAYDPEF
jgi:transcriptional regulator with XRE-family HTH domain